MPRKSYPSDITGKQWKLIYPHLPAAKERGRPRKTDLREYINPILYMSRTVFSGRCYQWSFLLDKQRMVISAHGVTMDAR